MTLALLAATSCAPAAPSTTPPESSCARAAVERARVRPLLAAGKLDRAVRVIQKADRLCPSTAGESSSALAATLAELGRTADASNAPPDPRALFAEGELAAKDGRLADAQRLFDRAVVALERRAGSDVRLDVPNAGADVHSIVFSPDGSLVALETSEGVELRDARTGELRREIAQRFIDDVRFSDDGASIDIHWHDGTGPFSGDTVRWSIADGRQLSGWDGRGRAPEPPGPAPKPYAAPGQPTSVFGYLEEVEVKRDAVRCDGKITSFAFAPNGKTAAFSTDTQTVCLGDLPGKPAWRRGRHSLDIRSIGFAPDGRTLLTGSGDGFARRWDLGSGRVTQLLGTGSGDIVGWSPDARLIVSGCGGPSGVCVRDSVIGEVLDQIPDVRVAPNVTSEIPWAWSSDSRWLALATTDGLRLWDLPHRAVRATLRTWDEGATPSVGLAFGPIGRPFAEATSDGAALWDTDSYARSGRFTSSFPVTAIAQSSHDLLAIAGQAAIDVFPSTPTTAPAELRGSNFVAPIALAFSPDGTLLAAARLDGVVDVWDLQNRHVRFSLDDRAEQPLALAFSPTGAVLAVGYRNGRGMKRGPSGRGSISGSVRLWSMEDGRLVATLRAIGSTLDSYVMTEGPDSRVEFFGAFGREFAVCRAGALTLPFDACAERFEVDGLLGKTLANDPSYLEP